MNIYETRREFIKISALGLGGAAVAGGTIKLAKGSSIFESLFGSDKNKDQRLVRYPTYCEVCFWKCAGWTYVNEDGEIVKVVGNEEDPHCNGRLLSQRYRWSGNVY